MKRIVSSLAVVASLAALANGCSSSSGGGGATITADEAAGQAAAAFCARANACSSFSMIAGYGDVATCTSRLKAQFLTQLAATGTGAAPQNYADCAGALPGVSCADLYASTLPAACKPAAGAVENGGVCFEHSQCKSKFCGIDASKGICGACVEPPAAEGTCASNDCQDGYTCGGDAKCHAIGGLDAACDADHVCNSTLVCFAKKCATPGKVGDACEATGTPTHPACNLGGGVYCNAKTSKCEQVTQTAATGAKCGLDATTGSLALCDGKSYCKITDTKTYVGSCAARVADGAACDTTNTLGNPCTLPASCKSGVCKLDDTSTCK